MLTKFKNLMKTPINPLVSLTVVFILLLGVSQIPLWSQIDDLQNRNQVLVNSQSTLIQIINAMNAEQARQSLRGTLPPTQGFMPTPEEVSKMQKEIQEELSDLENGVQPNPIKRHIRVNPKWGKEMI